MLNFFEGDFIKKTGLLSGVKLRKGTEGQRHKGTEAETPYKKNGNSYAIKILIAIVILIAWLSIEGSSAAVEVAPRISDREIIESLAEIKVTLKSLEEKLRQVDKRFEQVDRRFEQVDRRFEHIDRRFEEIQSNTRFLFGIVITMIIALFGYMVWDRRTMMKPQFTLS